MVPREWLRSPCVRRFDLSNLDLTSHPLEHTAVRSLVRNLPFALAILEVNVLILSRKVLEAAACNIMKMRHRLTVELLD